MCIFCQIINGDIPCNKVDENENFLAFHDINPKAPIHLLIIPKQHTESFHTAKDEQMVGMTSFIQRVAEKVGVDKSGYRIISNIGEDGGQEVEHLHLHLLGGTKLKFGHFTDANPRGNL